MNYSFFVIFNRTDFGLNRHANPNITTVYFYILNFVKIKISSTNKVRFEAFSMEKST